MIFKTGWKYWVFLFLLGFVLRMHSLWIPILNIDESQFAGYAHVLLNGGIPYVESVDTKPLGIYLFFAGIFWLFGLNNMIAIHVMTILWVFLTALFCYRIGEKLFSKRAGELAALFYIIFTTIYIPNIISTSIAIIMMLPLTISIDLLLEWERSGKNRLLWFSGMMWGLGCFFKYQAGVNGIAVAIYLLLLRPFWFRRATQCEDFTAFARFFFGGALMGAFFSFYLHNNELWDDFIFWSIHGSAIYVKNSAGVVAIIQEAALQFGSLVASGYLLWHTGIKRMIRLVRAIPKTEMSQFQRGEYLILLWFLLSLVAVSSGWRFYGHYFLQLFPALVLLAALPGMILWEQKRGFFLAGLIVPMIFFTMLRFWISPVYAFMGNQNMDEYRPISAYIKEHTLEKDRIFVWGFATPIYFFADRLPASRFLWCDWLTGREMGLKNSDGSFFQSSPQLEQATWSMLLEDLERHRPLYFVDTAPGGYHDYDRYPISSYPQLEAYLKRNYRLEITIANIDIYRRNFDIQRVE